MTSLLIIASVIAVIVAWVWFKFYQARGKIEHLLKTNAELEQHSQQQAVEIAVKNTQLNNHNTRIKNEENTHSTVREQLIDELHNDGDLRD